MKKENGLILALVVILVGASLLLAMTQFAAPAAAAGDDPAVMSKLDEIARNQKAVLAAVESMKADIAVIKIRVTQAQ